MTATGACCWAGAQVSTKNFGGVGGQSRENHFLTHAHVTKNKYNMVAYTKSIREMVAQRHKTQRNSATCIGSKRGHSPFSLQWEPWCFEAIFSGFSLFSSALMQLERSLHRSVVPSVCPSVITSLYLVFSYH